MDKFYEKLCKLPGTQDVRIREMMQKHTTFRIGGPADYFAAPADANSLLQMIALCKSEEKPYYILGNGSNLLVGDQGYHGVIIEMGKSWNYCKTEGDIITVGASVLLSVVAKAALMGHLSGFEFASGIPGSLGGAVVMNAGAYGSEMRDVLVSAQILTPNGKIKTVTGEELELGYRTSCISSKEWVVLEASIKLKPGKKEEILSRMEELSGKRKSKQPLEYPSAGSTFKRPDGYFAGKLIEDAGLRGYRVGGAQISEKHCGFVVNREHATASDVMTLCRDVREKVLAASGVTLELEVKTLGDF